MILRWCLILISSILVMAETSACINTDIKKNARTAKQFVEAVNNNDTRAALSLTSQKFYIRIQEWESASDGSGFVLGKKQDLRFLSKTKINDWLLQNINSIAVAKNDPRNVKSLELKQELDGYRSIWVNLNLYLFRRGMGDVEHLFVVGVDADNKVAAVYMN